MHACVTTDVSDLHMHLRVKLCGGDLSSVAWQTSAARASKVKPGVSVHTFAGASRGSSLTLPLNQF